MNYFGKFPSINYDFPDGVTRQIKNLSIRPGVVKEVLANHFNLQPYYVKEGETPDTIAYDHYGKPELHWVVMLTNEIINLYTDWPKTPSQFDSYMREKYGKQKTSLGTVVDLTEIELQRFVEFAGAPANKFQSWIHIDSDRNNNAVDSEGMLDDSEAYIKLIPHSLEWTPIDEINQEELQPVLINQETYANPITAFGNTYTFNGTVVPISIYQYEFELNESKRAINILRPSILNQLLSEFPGLVKQ